jgi:hypothetical protein
MTQSIQLSINASLMSVRLSDTLDVKRVLAQILMHNAGLSAVVMLCNYDPVMIGFDTISRGRVIFVTLID